jgi:hypothetical protein
MQCFLDIFTIEGPVTIIFICRWSSPANQHVSEVCDRFRPFSYRLRHAQCTGDFPLC